MRSWLRRAKSDCATCSPARLKGSSETRPAPCAHTNCGGKSGAATLIGYIRRSADRLVTINSPRNVLHAGAQTKLNSELSWGGGTAAALMTSLKDRKKKKIRWPTAAVGVQRAGVAACEWHPQMFFTCRAWMDSLRLFAWESSSRRQPHSSAQLPWQFHQGHTPSDLHPPLLTRLEKAAILKEFNMHETKVGGRKVQKRIWIKRLLGGNVSCATVPENDRLEHLCKHSTDQNLLS